MTPEQEQIIQERLKPLYQYSNLDFDNTMLVQRMVQDVNRAVAELQAFGIYSYDSEYSKRMGRQMVFRGLSYNPMTGGVEFNYMIN